MYYRNANCAVVVYDITQASSLEKAQNWIRELQRQADPSIVIALCGNKADLSARRQVTQEEAQKYAQEEGLMWSETSAKTGEGVADIFTAIGMYRRGFFCYDGLSVHSQEIATYCTPIITNGRHTRRSRRSTAGCRSQQASFISERWRCLQLLAARLSSVYSLDFDLSLSYSTCNLTYTVPC